MRLSKDKNIYVLNDEAVLKVIDYIDGKIIYEVVEYPGDDYWGTDLDEQIIDKEDLFNYNLILY